MSWQIYIVVTMLSTTSCNVARHLNEGEWLIERQAIEWIGSGAEGLDGQSVLRLSENRKTLGVRLHLRAHEIVRPEVLEERMSKRKQKGRNAEKGLRHWLVESFGEAPQLWEEGAGDRTVRNLETLARRAGFLGAKGTAVLDTLDGQRVAVRYRIDLGPLWRTGEVTWNAGPSGVDLTEFTGGSLLSQGGPFSVDGIEAERNRIARVLQDRGYAQFDEAYVSFRADTLGAREKGDFLIPLEVIIRPAVSGDGTNPDVPHARMRLGGIDINQQTVGSAQPLRSHVLDYLISTQVGELYNRKELEKTYRRLMRLPAVSRVEMPTAARRDSTGASVVDVEIKLWQRPRFGLQTELDFTRTDARYGPLARASWTDRNVSGRGDRLEWSVSAGISSTRPFSYSEGALVPNSGEWSVEANYSILGIPPLGLNRLKQSNSARSQVSLAFRRESRPDYLRKTLGFRYGFEFVENESRNSLINIDLIEFTYIDLESEPAFIEWLDSQTNAFLKSRFQDYAAPLTRVKWRTSWSEHSPCSGGFRASLEWSGQALHKFAPAMGLPVNDLGAYLVAGVPFAQFVRFEQELRLGTMTDSDQVKGQWMARAFFGMAWVGQNLGGLPYDRSFFGGGVNGLRGWATRDLGPGGVVDAEQSGVIRGLGDWRAEVNVEYRQPVTETFVLAIFSDAGNVWMRDGSASEASLESTWGGGKWQTVAWNTGLGMRWDFGFFLLRLDAGLRLHDPTQVLKERWIGQTKAKGAFHIGIGHPF
jgi:hypothetical protein